MQTESVTVRTKFCGPQQTSIRVAICQDIVTGGRTLASLSGTYRFECSVCGNRQRACPAVAANNLADGDATGLAEMVLKSLCKTSHARAVSQTELVQFASAFAMRGCTAQLAAVAKMLPLTFATIAQRALVRYPPELPLTIQMAYKFATAGINSDRINSAMLAASRASIPSPFENSSCSDADADDEAVSSPSFVTGSGNFVPIDEHIIAQRVSGWEHWCNHGTLDHRGHGWQRKIMYALYFGSNHILPIEICWRITSYIVQK